MYIFIYKYKAYVNKGVLPHKDLVHRPTEISWERKDFSEKKKHKIL